MNDLGLGFRCSWQDFRGWRERNPKEPRPRLMWADFYQLEDAERECRLRRAAGMTACVTPVSPPRVRRTRAKLPPDVWPLHHRAPAP